MVLLAFGKAAGFVRRPLAGSLSRVTIALLLLKAAEIDFCYLCRAHLALYVF